ncbi:unnamed protein product [Dovyalis caffra]|uniref:Uncharacterized protein n=1 Tax=Dovyalis caffra TaxID=77055 RepID=A0AAV1SJF0_9ROSI|nr:unnamed protein product [Dovyalis caffra]
MESCVLSRILTIAHESDVGKTTTVITASKIIFSGDLKERDSPTGNDTGFFSVGRKDGKVAPVGVFDKYPALVTGFFSFMWVTVSVRKHLIMHYFIVVCCGQPMDSNLLELLISVAVCPPLGHVTSNASFAAVVMFFTHTIKGDVKMALYCPKKLFPIGTKRMP